MFCSNFMALVCPQGCDGRIGCCNCLAIAVGMVSEMQSTSRKMRLVYHTSCSHADYRTTD